MQTVSNLETTLSDQERIIPLAIVKEKITTFEDRLKDIAKAAKIAREKVKMKKSRHLPMKQKPF